jgi:iron complex outermembrane receptor protein
MMHKAGGSGRGLLIMRRWGACATLACVLPCAADTVASTSLVDLSLEQLRDVVVTTVSRTEESFARAPASVYVIRGEDIRRAGVTTLPEALRLAPTLDVARADANQYAIAARGFNNVLANRMLVLIDGRTVYTPLFSGVFWEAQDVPLADVDRIEVVTGPSTALWGTNALDGLIHVITKAAGATQGPAVFAHVGSRDRGGLARWGLPLPGGHARIYAKAYDRDATRRADGSSVFDQADGAQVGFRADWAHASSTLTVQGDAYEGRIGQGSLPHRTFSGGNLLSRWEARLGSGAQASVQAYVERTRRRHPQVFEETLDTADVVAQYEFAPAGRHRLLLGAGWRRADDETVPSAAVAFVPPSRTLTWTRAFAQDRIALSKRWSATAAASIEHNPYTGTEVLPSVRLSWESHQRALWWMGLSRAVRAPSRIDRDFVQPAQPPFIIAGGPDFRSEVSDVLEIGRRAQPDPRLSYSVAAFYARHRRLRSLFPTPGGLEFRNDIEGRSRGLETWARWRVQERWRLDAGATVLRKALRVRAGGVDAGGLASLGNDPRHWWTLRSSLDVSSGVAWDVSVRHVGARPAPPVPGYTAADMRLAWQVTPQAELALVVQNLFDAGHSEWGPAANRVELERAYQLQLRWRAP